MVIQCNAVWHRGKAGGWSHEKRSEKFTATHSGVIAAQSSTKRFALLAGRTFQKGTSERCYGNKFAQICDLDSGTGYLAFSVCTTHNKIEKNESLYIRIYDAG